MESLMSMDDETLDSVLESCNDEELAFIDEAIEATATMTSKDKEDFNTIERIQRKARSGGWGSVPKEDRDEFVKIMSNTNNLSVLKKAKSLGEREASHDDRVKGALRSLGLTAGGAAVGAGAGAAIGAINQSKSSMSKLRERLNKFNDEIERVNTSNSDNKFRIKNIKDKISDAQSNLSDSLYNIDGANHKSGDDIRYAIGDLERDYSNGFSFDITERNLVNTANDIRDLTRDGAAAARGARDRLSEINLDRININKIPEMDVDQLNILQRKIEAAARSGAAKGAGVGALTGAGISAALAAIKKAKRYQKDSKDVMAQGDAMHPDKQWKLNRKNKK